MVDKRPNGVSCMRELMFSAGGWDKMVVHLVSILSGLTLGAIAALIVFRRTGDGDSTSFAGLVVGALSTELIDAWIALRFLRLNEWNRSFLIDRIPPGDIVSRPRRRRSTVVNNSSLRALPKTWSRG